MCIKCLCISEVLKKRDKNKTVRELRARASEVLERSSTFKGEDHYKRKCLQAASQGRNWQWFWRQMSTVNVPHGPLDCHYRAGRCGVFHPQMAFYVSWDTLPEKNGISGKHNGSTLDILICWIGLAPTKNKHCDSNATPTCSAIGEKCYLQSLKLMKYNKIYRNMSFSTLHLTFSTTSMIPSSNCSFIGILCVFNETLLAVGTICDLLPFNHLSATTKWQSRKVCLSVQCLVIWYPIEGCIKVTKLVWGWC